MNSAARGGEGEGSHETLSSVSRKEGERKSLGERLADKRKT